MDPSGPRYEQKHACLVCREGGGVISAFLYMPRLTPEHENVFTLLKKHHYTKKCKSLNTLTILLSVWQIQCFKWLLLF